MQNINSVISRTESLNRLYAHSLEIIRLQEAIRAGIGKPLSDHLFLAHMDTEKLVIYTDGPAWAAKLRFSSSDILKTIRQFPAFKNTSSVRVKINPSLHSAAQTESMPSLSPLAAQHLLSVAHEITDDKLQASLLKLAQNRQF